MHGQTERQTGHPLEDVVVGGAGVLLGLLLTALGGALNLGERGAKLTQTQSNFKHPSSVAVHRSHGM